LQRAGQIKDLQRQVKFELIPKQDGERACNYIADYVYTENGQTIVEDAKGLATKDYIIKRKLFKQKYPEYRFIETRLK
jgi:ABC-type sulfate transport system substrate-binding protein